MMSSIQEAAPATDVSRFNAAEWLEEHAAGAILMTPDGWMTEANRSARRIFRLPPTQEVRGLNFRRFCRQPARFADTVQAIRTAGYVGSWDADLVAMDGRIVHAVVNLVGEFESGFLTAVRVQLFDIADWRRSQERTLFGQRIEAIGRLAGGVAHDFNNLLMVITGHAECLSAAFEADSPMTRSVAAIRASAARAATLTEKLLSFGRRQVLQPRVVDPRDMVRQLEQDLRRASPLAPIMIEADRVWPVRVDEARTQGALCAIASHALETMDGGTLTFQLANADIGPEWSPTRAFVKPGRFVRIDLVCTGMTLDADTHVRMFEPFFSETGVVRDGMGLAAAFGTVKQGGGYMWIEADRPGSTTFTVLLPAVVADAADAGSGGRETAAPATVIVVNADDGVRRMIVKILATQRYVVLGAATPDEALRLGGRGGIDVLLVDAVPGVEWHGIADAMRRDSPRLRLIGLAREPDDEAGANHTGAVVLQKPFTATELLERVRSVLAA